MALFRSHILFPAYCPICAALLGLSSCVSLPESHEARAMEVLTEARQLMAQKQYAPARDSIMSLRQRFPLALETRRAAIVTLDSVELLATRDSIQRYELELNAARQGLKHLQPRVGGQTNELYYAQQRRVYDMEQHFDELCAKVKFYVRKIENDTRDL